MESKSSKLNRGMARGICSIPHFETGCGSKFETRGGHILVYICTVVYPITGVPNFDPYLGLVVVDVQKNVLTPILINLTQPGVLKNRSEYVAPSEDNEVGIILQDNEGCVWDSEPFARFGCDEDPNWSSIRLMFRMWNHCSRFLTLSRWPDFKSCGVCARPCEKEIAT